MKAPAFPNCFLITVMAAQMAGAPLVAQPAPGVPSPYPMYVHPTMYVMRPSGQMVAQVGDQGQQHPPQHFYPQAARPTYFCEYGGRMT